jgi:hypothetical protein
MRRIVLGLALAVLPASCGGKQSSPPAPTDVELRAAGPGQLLAVAEFDAIGDRAARSRALFTEASRVLLHPRCVNCHPADDTPRQRSTMELHDPPVVRGPDNKGVVGMQCQGCHQDRNQAHTRIPGAPGWHLAPIEMAWQGKSLAHICNQMKDRTRNGGKTLAEIVEHSAHDELVAWGWSPGADREPAPGTQEAFGALVAAWVETGAECPPETTESEAP